MRRLVLAVSLVGLLLLSATSALAASGNSVWRVALKTGSVHGGATLAELANGNGASLAVKLYGVKPGTVVTISLNDGANGTTAVIANRDKFKAPAAGPATHRFWLTKAELKVLKTAITNKDTLSVTATATAGATGPTVTLTGNLVALR